MRSRPPKPDVIKIAQGTMRKHRAKKRPPKASNEIPPSPFESGTIADKKWTEITEGLKRFGLIDHIDATHIEGLCHHYQVAKIADAQIAIDGITVIGAAGSLIKNPACTVSAHAWGLVRGYCNDLGLNHLSRQRMQSNASHEESEKEDRYFGNG